ncbi:MAG: hypothetical protein JJ992_30395 [Planctomycetes bacterium]|nr:hypothetical protein [Planctomycetota bacterium]
MNARTVRHNVVAVVAGALLAASAQAQEIAKVNAFYFGNSFCENSMPWLQPMLAKSAGHELKVRTQFGPGWQIWMHVDQMMTKPDVSKKPLVEGDWNAIVIQHFGAHPLLQENVRTSVFASQKEPWPEPRDVSDFASASWIIDAFLAAHPQGRVFIYSSWPGIPAAAEFRKRVADETKKSLEAQGLPRDEVLKQVKERKPTLEEMIPLMKAFDYGAGWLAKYEPNRETPHESKHFHSRDYDWSLIELLKKKYLQLWSEGRLALIPNGDVFYALDQKMRAGQVPGVENIGFCSRDGGHVRAGLPRYTLAATCFAVMFRDNPTKLDASVYNELENYTNESLKNTPGHEGSAYSHQPDLGVLLEITPQRKKIVDETIWEVVKNHPYTNVK